jgi:peptide subunit release factor 1 (eRF1)
MTTITESQLLEALNTASSAYNGTHLITYYLPESFQLVQAREHIINELSTASNIKNKNIRSAVISGLKSIQYQMKSMKTIPANGIAIYAGEFDTKIDIPCESCV